MVAASSASNGPASQPPPTAVIFHLGASTDLDVASLDMLQALIVELEESGIKVFFAQVRAGVRDRLRKTGIMETVGVHNVYPSVDAAVYDFQQGTAPVGAHDLPAQGA